MIQRTLNKLMTAVFFFCYTSQAPFITNASRIFSIMNFDGISLISSIKIREDSKKLKSFFAIIKIIIKIMKMKI